MASDSDVLLGYVGRKLPADKQLDLRLSRLGGDPIWSKAPSADSPLSRPTFFTCELCGKPLVLLTQISAAYGDRAKRLLHVFTCSGSCGCDPRAWRVVRSVGPLAAADEDMPQAACGAAEGAAAPSKVEVKSDAGSFGADWGAPAADDWGAPAADDWGASAGSAAAPDADLEIAALLAARGSSAAPSSKAVAPVAKAAVDEAADDSYWSGVRGTTSPIKSWPCISLSIDYEPSADPSGDNGGAHEQELLRRYQQGELAEEEADRLAATDAMPTEVEAEAASLRAEAERAPEATRGAE
ncbi:unnamed protein product, partial [Polarella glacialis]